MRQYYTPTNIAKDRLKGFTLVELIVTIFISSLLMLSIADLITSITRQYSISTARNILTAELSSSMNRLDNDVKFSDRVLAESPVDPSGPLSNGRQWETNTATSQDTVVLTTLARTSSGESIDSEYPGQADVLVYYVRNGSLYRRLVAANDPDNRYDTLTCTATSGGGCPADEKLMEHVTVFNVSFYRSSGPTSNPSQATSIKFTIEVETVQAGQTITQSSTVLSHLSGTETQLP